MSRTCVGGYCYFVVVILRHAPARADSTLSLDGSCYKSALREGSRHSLRKSSFFDLGVCCRMPFRLQSLGSGCGFAEILRQILRICLKIST